MNPLSRLARHLKQAVRFDRNEWSGAFGDLGTDFPLVVGMIAAGGLDPTAVLVMFGVMQLFAGLVYGIPMPAQPLKAMAVFVIAGQASGAELYGGGLAIGLTMLLLVGTGLIDLLARTIPKCVIRGIQLGLGLKLSTMALQYIFGKTLPGYEAESPWAGAALAAIACGITLALIGNRKYPPALLIILLGIAYAWIFKEHDALDASVLGFNLPTPQAPTLPDIWNGFLHLALAQIALSLGNSVLATKQLAADLFPEKKVTVRKIGLTYSIMNLISPFFGGLPTCHGSGGMAGHHAFGARTGGSVVIYGLFFLGLGLFFADGFDQLVHLFPLPILGVILLFEGFALIRMVRDQFGLAAPFGVAVAVGLMSFLIPRYGFLCGLVIGTLVAYPLGAGPRREAGE